MRRRRKIERRRKEEERRKEGVAEEGEEQEMPKSIEGNEEGRRKCDQKERLRR